MFMIKRRGRRTEEDQELDERCTNRPLRVGYLPSHNDVANSSTCHVLVPRGGLEKKKRYSYYCTIRYIADFRVSLLFLCNQNFMFK